MSRSGSGVYFEVHGEGFPILLGYPITASPMYPDESGTIIRAYLDGLADRYSVILVDYPDLGLRNGRDPVVGGEELTADRVCADMLGVVDAAGFDRFAWWGYSWGGVIGLQIAARSDRIAALICGGWPPLGGPYDRLLEATRAAEADKPASFYIPPRQFVTFYESVREWDERGALARLQCPRFAYVGTEDAVEIAGLPVPLAELMRANRQELESWGWAVVEIPGKDHLLWTEPDAVLRVVRPFLDAALPNATPARSALA